MSQASTGVSPNELVFGHSVQGPLAVLGAILKPGEPPEDVLDYVRGRQPAAPQPHAALWRLSCGSLRF